VNVKNVMNYHKSIIIMRKIKLKLNIPYIFCYIHENNKVSFSCCSKVLLIKLYIPIVKT